MFIWSLKHFSSNYLSFVSIRRWGHWGWKLVVLCSNVPRDFSLQRFVHFHFDFKFLYINRLEQHDDFSCLLFWGFKTKSLKCSNFSFRTTTVRLSAFDVQASQLHKNLFRVRVELTIIVATRISPKFVGGQNHLSTISVCNVFL